MSSRRKRSSGVKRNRSQNGNEFLHRNPPNEPSTKTVDSQIFEQPPVTTQIADNHLDVLTSPTKCSGISEPSISTASAPSDSQPISNDVEMKDLEVPILTTEQLAEAKKTEGNGFYANKDYQSALRLYTEAIVLCPQCSAYYGNRAATYMMLSQYDKAVEDSRRSTVLDPTFLKGYLREAKCHLLMGEVATANLLYDKVLSVEPTNSTAKSESLQAKALQEYLGKAETASLKGDHRTVLFCMDRSIEISPECKKFRVAKAECLAFLKRYQEAQEIANDILRSDSINADAIYVRGICFYYQDNAEKAFQHFQQVIRLAPDHVKTQGVYRKAKLLIQKKEEGNAAFKAGKLQEANDLYAEALSIDPINVATNSKLHFNRATVLANMGKASDAITACTKAIDLDENYLKAYHRRARCYTELEKYEEAVSDYETCFKISKTAEYKRLLQDAKLELKKSKRKDYYKILGLGRDANEDAIKKAYRKYALLHHPDRHSSETEETKKIEEKKFKEIGEAYSILSDPKKKARYDSGQDLDDCDDGMHGFHGFHDCDPDRIFQKFFSSSGGGESFGFGGFPGGFTFQFG